MEEENTAEDSDESPKKKKKSSLKSKLGWFVIILVSLAVLRQASIVLLLAMLPTLVVKFTDESDDNLWFRCIFCFNLAGIYPFLVDMFMASGITTRVVQDMMGNSFMWFSAYGAAGVGYLSMWFFPNLSEFLLRVFNTKRIDRHKRKLKRLHDEWGVGDPVLFE